MATVATARTIHKFHFRALLPGSGSMAEAQADGEPFITCFFVQKVSVFVLPSPWAMEHETHPACIFTPRAGTACQRRNTATIRDATTIRQGKAGT